MSSIINQVEAIDWNTPRFDQWGVNMKKYLQKLLNYRELSDDDLISLADAICSTISHQGDISEITLVVVPILINIVKQAEDHKKALILLNLTCLSFALHYKQDLRQSVYEMMYHEIDLWHSYLTHHRQDIREKAARILSNFTMHVDPVIHWLCDALENKSELERTFIFGRIISLVVYNEHPIPEHVPDQVLHRVKKYLYSISVMERVSAASVFLLFEKREINSTAKEIILQFVRTYSEPEDLYSPSSLHLYIALLDINTKTKPQVTLQQFFPELTQEEIQNCLGSL